MPYVASLLLACLLFSPAVPASFVEYEPPVVRPLFVSRVLASLIDESDGGECVEFVKRFFGWPESCEAWDCEPLGRARDIKPNSETPIVGSAVLLDEGANGHMAVIIGMRGETLE